MTVLYIIFTSLSIIPGLGTTINSFTAFSLPGADFPLERMVTIGSGRLKSSGI